MWFPEHALRGALMLGACLSVPAAAENCPQVAGYLETARIGEPALTLEAKLDTGADTSALDARDIKPFARDGDQWVAFTTRTPAGVAPLTARLVRWVRIRRAGTEPARRPVVVLPLCIGGQSMMAEFTLNDRSGQATPILIGRAALAGRIAVDSARDHTAEASCPPAKP